jgi:predicted O-methyltransferase YrrM
VAEVPLESSWTRPHRGCLHPEHWHAHDSDSTEVEVGALIGSLVTALQPELVIETGSAFGHTTEQIGKALAANRHGHCLSLEIDQGRATLARSRCKGLPVRILTESSLDFEPPGQIDLLFSDSDYAVRRPEIEHLSQWMEPGAIITVHDTTSAERGHHMNMHREVEQLQASGLLRAVYLPTPRGLAICQLL